MEKDKQMISVLQLRGKVRTAAAAAAGYHSA